MEKFLVALDNTEVSLNITSYLARTMRGAPHIHLTLYHVLPNVSPKILTKEEVQKFAEIHEKYPHFRGLFWRSEDEEKMNGIFHKAMELLHEGGFNKDQVFTHFRVHSGEVAPLILEGAKQLNCSTIVMGRRGLSRVRKFLWGSVSRSVTKMSKNITVWIVDS